MKLSLMPLWVLVTAWWLERRRPQTLVIEEYRLEINRFMEYLPQPANRLQCWLYAKVVNWAVKDSVDLNRLDALGVAVVGSLPRGEK